MNLESVTINMLGAAPAMSDRQGKTHDRQRFRPRKRTSRPRRPDQVADRGDHLRTTTAKSAGSPGPSSPLGCDHSSSAARPRSRGERDKRTRLAPQCTRAACRKPIVPGGGVALCAPSAAVGRMPQRHSMCMPYQQRAEALEAPVLQISGCRVRLRSWSAGILEAIPRPSVFRCADRRVNVDIVRQGHHRPGQGWWRTSLRRGLRGKHSVTTEAHGLRAAEDRRPDAGGGGWGCMGGMVGRVLRPSATDLIDRKAASGGLLFPK